MNGYEQFMSEIEAGLVCPTKRVIYTCKGCRHVFAYDYLVVEAGHGLPAGLYRLDAARFLLTPEQDMHHCPACSFRYCKPAEVVGKASRKPCDERCMDAKTSVCCCSCSGANHGKAHLVGGSHG